MSEVLHTYFRTDDDGCAHILCWMGPGQYVRSEVIAESDDPDVTPARMYHYYKVDEVLQLEKPFGDLIGDVTDVL